MPKRLCKLDSGFVTPYNAAFPLSSTAEISPQLTYIGTGVIIEIAGKPYRGKTRLKFYKTIKEVKYNGYQI